jgi:hypothetical protein
MKIQFVEITLYYIIILLLLGRGESTFIILFYFQFDKLQIFTQFLASGFENDFSKVRQVEKFKPTSLGHCFWVPDLINYKLIAPIHVLNVMC